MSSAPSNVFSDVFPDVFSNATWPQLATISLQVTRVFDIITFFLSVFINSVLLYLIKSESPAYFGNYKYLMMSFSINSLMLATVHAFLQPIISTEKYVAFVFTSTNYLDLPRVAMRALLAIYGMIYGQTMMLIAVHFVYRCFSISRRKYMHYFKGGYFALWYALVAGCGAIWGLCIFLIAQETPEVDDLLRPMMSSTFDLNMSDVFYVAASYETKDYDGKTTWNWKAIFMVIYFASVMTFSMSLIILSIYFIHYRTQNVNKSQAYKEVQKQLFRALISQMVIPLCLIYIPPASALTLPVFFHIRNSFPASLPSILISIYPVIDSIAVILIISVYRQGFRKLFTIKRKRRVKPYEISMF